MFFSSIDDYVSIGCFKNREMSTFHINNSSTNRQFPVIIFNEYNFAQTI